MLLRLMRGLDCSSSTVLGWFFLLSSSWCISGMHGDLHFIVYISHAVFLFYFQQLFSCMHLLIVPKARMVSRFIFWAEENEESITYRSRQYGRIAGDTHL